MSKSKQLNIKVLSRKEMLKHYRNEVKSLPETIQKLEKQLSKAKNRLSMLPGIIDYMLQDIEYLENKTVIMIDKEKLQKKYYKEKEKLYEMENEIRKIK